MMMMMRSYLSLLLAVLTVTAKVSVWSGRMVA